MYALYSPDGVVLERVRGALPPDEVGIVTMSWNELAAAAQRADCLLIAARWLASELCLSLRAVMLGSHPVPVVLIITKDADNARAALHTGATRIVWLEDVRRELRWVLCTMRPRLVLDQAAVLLERSTQLSRPLGTALAYACRTERPILSVGAFAELVRRDRRTLWRHWHRATGGCGPLRLEDFLDWVLLLHAAHLKAPSRSWMRVAHALGTHEHTLARIVTRLAGVTLTQFGESARQDLGERFLDSAVRPLVAGADKVGWPATFCGCSPSAERSL